MSSINKIKKIKQVKDCSLLVEIDIGSIICYVGVFDWRGNGIKFSNRREGFQSLFGWMQHMMKKPDESGNIVGIEPTGNYWFAFGVSLENDGILVSFG